MKTTKSGNHVVYHAFQCPFARKDARVPQDHLDLIENGCWFFIPSTGNPTPFGDRRGYPVVYSPSYGTEAEALLAAELWELK